MAHKRQRPAGEDLHLVGQRNLRQIHESLRRVVVTRLYGFIPGVGGEVVDLTSDMQDRFAQRMVLRGPVRVRDDDLALRLGSGRCAPRSAAPW